MYKSPIEIIYGEMETQMEGMILKAVQKVGVDVDKEELICALRYDRGQYDKGYQDAKQEQRWIPVSERKPTEEDATESGLVLVYTNNNEHLIVDYKDVWRFYDFISHWMQLPEPPKGE